MLETVLLAFLLVAAVGVTRMLFAARDERRRGEPGGDRPLFFVRYLPPEILQPTAEPWAGREKH
ncbi:MAG: hypothetical protein KAY32_00450 [Candidatus Eisenbacteria sp.]|nr:hypothetical protein [Candidatus Eisenbacteria bacterium]